MEKLKCWWCGKKHEDIDEITCFYCPKCTKEVNYILEEEFKNDWASI